GKYRLRLRDRGMAERTRDETAGPLREVDGLFQGRMALALEGPTSVEGRSAFRYTIRLADAAGDKPARGETPPAAGYARAGLDEDSARRQLHVVLDQRLKDVGKAIAIQVPEGHLPDADKPEGIADALDRFGIQRK